MSKENRANPNPNRDLDWHDYTLAGIDPKDERRRMGETRQRAKKELGLTEKELDAAFGIRSRMR